MGDNNEYKKQFTAKTDNNAKSEKDESANNRILQDNREKICEIFKETLENFDKMKIFKFYFIMNNFDKVIKKLKKKKLSPLKTRRSGNMSGSLIKGREPRSSNSPSRFNRIETMIKK